MAGAIDITWALYGLEEFKITSIRDILTKVITAVCIFIFVKDAADVWKYSLIYSVGFFVSQAVSIPILFRKVKFVKPSLAGVKTHIKPNLVLFLSTSLCMGIMAVSREFVTLYFGEDLKSVSSFF